VKGTAIAKDRVGRRMRFWNSRAGILGEAVWNGPYNVEVTEVLEDGEVVSETECLCQLTSGLAVGNPQLLDNGPSSRK
jgi:hypothetical protein